MLPSTQELLKKSYALYKKNLKTIFKFTGVLAVPLFFTALCKFLFTFTLDENTEIIQLIAPAILIFALYLLTLWATVTFIRVLSKLYTNDSIQSVGKELHISLPLLLPSFFAILLMACAIIGGLALLIIPGIIFSISFFFSVYSVALDGKRGTAALHYSKFLVKGKWWDVLWLLFSTTFLIVLANIILQALLRFIFTLLIQFSGEGTRLATVVNINALLLEFVISMIILPLSAAVPTILYNELKKLKNN